MTWLLVQGQTCATQAAKLQFLKTVTACHPLQLGLHRIFHAIWYSVRIFTPHILTGHDKTALEAVKLTLFVVLIF